jgi:hypothetical protein
MTRRTPAPVRVLGWVLAAVAGLVALLFLFRYLETLLPANF